MGAPEDRETWIDGWTPDGRRVRVEGPVHDATVTVDGVELAQVRPPEVLRDGGTKRWFTEAGVAHHPPRMFRPEAPSTFDDEPLRPGPDDPSRSARRR